MSKKRPRQKEIASSKKHPIEKVNANSYLKKRPNWKFYRSDDTHKKWSLKNNCDINVELLDRLESFETMQWSEIQVINGSENHFVDISSLCKDARKRILELHLDVDELFSLRITGKKRLWGILDNGVFSIVWYDPKHEVCPAPKKYT